MTATTKSPTPEAHESNAQHVNELLDEALEESFPASDPVAIALDPPEKNPPGPPRTP